jgi:predicted nucleic acid-binding Zn ribbon protein
MKNCLRCGKELSREQVWNKRRYCSKKCAANSRERKEVEWNGVQMYPGKYLEVLKLCCGGMPPKEAIESAGSSYSSLERLRENPAAASLLYERVCPICGEYLPPPLQRRYCSDKCRWKASYEREARAKGINPRVIDYEGRQKAFDLYQVRCRLDEAETAEEWTEILRNSDVVTETSETVILVCGFLHGSGAPGRYVSIAAEQFWQKDFCIGTCIAFCNILKNAITTIELQGDNFKMTRTFKTSGTFVWPDEKLGKSIDVTKAEFERLLTIKKHRKNVDKP